MKKYKFLCCFLFIIFSTTYSQISDKHCSAKIFYSSKDFFETSTTDNVKRVWVNVFSNEVVARTLNGNKIKVPIAKVWGIRRKNDYSSRFFNGFLYDIIEIKPLFLYLNGTKVRTCYFSIDENSTLYKFTEENLKTYANEEVYNLVMSNKRLKNKLE